MAYRFLDHTADLAVELDAPTLDALFTDAAAAYTACLVDPATVEERERRDISVTAGDRDVTKRFAVREDGRYLGLVTGLDLGRTVLKATAPGATAGRAVVVNHPNGGPVFSGPQHRYYRCQESAVDEQCNEPASYDFLYKSSNPLSPGLQPYDPQNPPSDVATTTTDEGASVAFSGSVALGPKVFSGRYDDLAKLTGLASATDATSEGAGE